MGSNLNIRKAVLGLSGGVDSTAAALLLKENGFSVTAAYLDVFGNNQQGRGQAEKTARQLGIDIVTSDVSKEFGELIITDFCAEYMRGRTPSPCVICNPLVKFKALLKIANDIGARFIATGHYAGVTESEGNYFVKKAKNNKKDQSYMLYRLDQEALSRLILPLGEFETKGETRNFVSEKGIENSALRDSQEICFIPPDTHYADFIKEQGYDVFGGEFVDIYGNTIGRHGGIQNFTVGQRKNLGITFGKPVFVVNIDGETNRVTLGASEDLLKCEVFSKNNWFSGNDSEKIPEKYEGAEVTAKVRYTSFPAEAVISASDAGIVRSVFKTAQRAVTPGQSIVFYDGDIVIGGGVIDKAAP